MNYTSYGTEPKVTLLQSHWVQCVFLWNRRMGFSAQLCLVVYMTRWVSMPRPASVKPVEPAKHEQYLAAQQHTCRPTRRFSIITCAVYKPCASNMKTLAVKLTRLPLLLLLQQLLWFNRCLSLSSIPPHGAGEIGMSLTKYQCHNVISKQLSHLAGTWPLTRHTQQNRSGHLNFYRAVCNADAV